MLFDSNGKHNSFTNITINNSVIEKVQLTKFLGVFIDEKLQWSFHIILIR